MILLITYDLHKPGQNYEGLHEEIKKYGTWWHHLDSTWLVSTTDTPTQCMKKLRQHMDDNDNLLVIEVCDNYNGWLPQKAWDWLHKRNFRC